MFGEVLLQESKVTVVEFHPETIALNVLLPPCPHISPPVLFDPVPDRPFAKIVPHFFAFDPLKTILLKHTIGVNTTPIYHTAGMMLVTVELGRFHLFYT